jgi:import inner membrane translocase subunit TIM13
MSLFGSSVPAPSKSSEEIKASLVQQLQQESAMNNARALIGKINEHCYDACIPAPGSSLSSKESGCLSSCMEKYIAMWNVTSRTYIARVNQESKKMGGDASALVAMGTQ